MKPSIPSPIFSLIATLALAAVTASSALAGPYQRDIAELDFTDELVYQEPSDPILTGAFSAGYESQYIYRGRSIGGDTLWTNIQFEVNPAADLYVSGTALYTNVISDAVTYSEANFGLNVSYVSGEGTVSLGFLHYQFFDGFSGKRPDGQPVNNTSQGTQTDSTEIYLGISNSTVYDIYAYASAVYDLRIDAFYFEAGFAKEWEVHEDISIDFAASVGYSFDDYYATIGGDAADGFTHGMVSLAAPIALTESLTFTPHLSANFSLNARDNTNADTIGNTEVFFGLSLSNTF